MNFKKTWKRFFTVSRASEGFTLVELIVVIAILAILAGTAVPAYSGYIKKANKAADLQLLGAVNTAFAAAALENNVDVMEVTGVRPIWSGSVNPKSITGVSMYNDEFMKYFAGNETATFKVIEQLRFVNGVFVDPTTNPEGVNTYSYAGGTLYLTDAEIANLGNSTFLSATTLGGSAGLLGQIDMVTNVAAGMSGTSLSAVFNDPAFQQCAMNALGVSTQEEYTAKQEELLADMMAQNEGMTRAEAEAQLGANAAVLYASQAAVNYSDAQIGELFSSTGVQAIKDNLMGVNGGNTTDGMAQAALVYGMYTAYANSAAYTTEELRANVNNPLAVLNALDTDANFKTYINSAQGQADLDAYMSALGVINDSATGNASAVEHLMVNGFNNGDLTTLLQGALGK